MLRCAREIFAQKGYHRTNISDIIAAARIARGTFYLYFENKRAIFDELLDELLATIQGCIRKIDVEPGALPVIEQMRGNVERVVDTLFENRDMTEILFRAAVGLDPDFDSKLDGFYERVIDLATNSISNGIEMGLVRRCDPALVAQFIIGGIKEVALHAIVRAGLRADTTSRRRIAAEVLEFVARALFVPEAHERVRSPFAVGQR